MAQNLTPALSNPAAHLSDIARPSPLKPKVSVPRSHKVLPATDAVLHSKQYDEVGPVSYHAKDCPYSVDGEPESTPSLASRQNSTSSSIYSSASALARARASHPKQPEPVNYPHASDESFGSSTNNDLAPYPSCLPSPPHEEDVSIRLSHAPYLVPQTQDIQDKQVTLVWEPDLESRAYDPAEDLWRRLDAKLGRVSSTKERGRWVVSALEKNTATDVEMIREESDFSISAYMDTDESIFHFENEQDGERRDVDGTILFDMKGPLIPSVSSWAATPANTPFIRYDSLRRVGRVVPSGRSRYSTTGPVEEGDDVAYYDLAELDHETETHHWPITVRLGGFQLNDHL
jgi:hypothetical protein